MDSLIGITIHDWLKLLAQNHFRIAPLYWFKMAFVTGLSIRNSIRKKREERLYSRAWDQMKIEKDPIFILGHWRSGTTLLQNLMLLDKQFAFPAVYQCNRPFTFLLAEPKVRKLSEKYDPQARPMDDVKVSPLSPGEEEFALAVLTLRSPLLAWIFPRNEDNYDRYLTFNHVSDEEIEQWKSAFLFFIKKITYRYNRQLLLKSPPNTARIKLLLELFPNAKFIHIHRNPYVVFQSTRRLYEKALPTAWMQRPPSNNFIPGIIKRYAWMYDSYFEQRRLIPRGNLIEIKFEDLEQDKIGLTNKIYEQLNIAGFPALKPKLEQYVNSISNYKKNKHPVIENQVKEQIARAWQKSFQEWGYSI